MRTYQTFEGNLAAEGHRYGIVASRFNELIVGKLLEGCLNALRRHGAQESQQTVVWVPGAMEIPLAAQRLAARETCDGVICLGTVIRGSTPHFDLVVHGAANGIVETALRQEKPVIFGILTTETIEQAIERAGTKMGNKGWDAALAGIEMVNLMKLLEV